MFEPFDVEDLENDMKDIKDTIILRGKMNDVIKINKKLKKDIIKLNNTINKYETALRIRSGEILIHLVNYYIKLNNFSCYLYIF